MDNLQVKAILAGVFFGLWPLFMNKSGLSGNVSAIAFSGLVLLFVTPFAFGEIGHVVNTRWIMVFVAGALGALGVMCFNGMLAKATPQSVGTLMVLMVVVQTSVLTVNQIVQDGSITLIKGIGFVLAGIAAILLIKG